MQEVVEYLEIKNQYYEKFYSLTKKFLAQVEKNNWNGIDVFVDNRERLLNIIRSFDYKISRAMEEANLSPVELEAWKPNVKGLLDKRKEIADRIVGLDLDLIGRLDDYKSESLRALKQQVESEQHVQAFNKTARKNHRVKDV